MSDLVSLKVFLFYFEEKLGEDELRKTMMLQMIIRFG